MADLMEQYANVSSSGAETTYVNAPNNELEIMKTGFVRLTTEDDRPVFQRERLSFKPPSRIVDMAIANNIMVIGMEEGQIKRIDLNNQMDSDTFDIAKKPEDKVERLFLDPTGHHLLISLNSSETLYLGRNNKKPRSLARMKNTKVTSIGWNKVHRTDITTGAILIGTNKGIVYETEIDSEEKFLSMGTDKQLKQIFNMNDGRSEEEEISNIQIEKFPNLEKRFVVFVSTKSRFYQFVGDIGNEAPIFNPVLNVFHPNPTPYLELPGEIYKSDFSLYYPRGNGQPKYFGWLTGAGVYFGQLDYNRSSLKQNVTAESRLLKTTESKQDPPVSISITDFHCVLLYENRFETVCILNDEENYSENLPPRYGTFIGLRTDSVKKTLWAFSEGYVFQYKINNESRDVWKLYLDREEFELAKDYCKNNPAQMDLVLRKQAESLFAEKKYQQAAAYFALTQISFEEVSLKFLQVKDSESLKMFLQKKMINLKANDKTQLMMLVTWVIELYLNQLGELRDRGTKGSKYETLQDEFEKFLNQSKVKGCLELNKHVAYELLSSHADTNNMIFFAMLMHDYQRVIQHYIQKDDYLSALDVLKKQRDNYQPLFEQFSPTLIQHIPKELLELWKQRDLDPRKMIPALVTQTESNDMKCIQYAVKYLEHCVYNLKNTELAIHNYLISLYCKMDDQRPLLNYLNSQGEDSDTVCYDLKYALRLCSENGKDQAAVQIYSTMCLYEEAVDLALKVDIEKAKLYADKPEYDDALRKKLWLKIARHVVERQQDVGRAMDLLKECPLLKIEDILPFFPDFVTIDHFKDAICESLQEYNKHIDKLQEDMQEATESAKVVRSEIHDIRNRYGCIDAQEKCCLCGYPLVTRSFYYFPCSHVFHSDCLITKVKDKAKGKQRKKIDELMTEIRDADSRPSNSSAKEKLQEQLDELVASECYLCGETMIRCLDEPLILSNEFEQQLENWK